MEDETNILPGNHVRGWNDPPQFMYEAQKQGGTITPSNPLATNKRVGHDLSSGSTTQTGVVQHSGAAPPSSSTPPPVLHGLAHVPILNMPSKSIPSTGGDKSITQQIIDVPDISDDAELCQYCVKCFSECSEKLKEKNHIEARLANDVTKRIMMFEKSWKSGKLSAMAKPVCAKLARALELEAYSAAHDVHLKLMTDHISEVSQWMVGIKKLIQAGVDKSQL